MKVIWGVWSVLFLLVALGSGAVLIDSYSPEVPIKLMPGERGELSVIRFAPSRLRPEIHFNRPREERDGEGGFRELRDGTIQIVSPGEPIVLRFKLDSQDSPQLFAALPVTGYSTGFWRGMIPVETAGLPTSVPNPLPSIMMPGGWIHMTFEVVSVGPRIAAETVSISLEPPVGLKYTEPGHRWLAVFNFAELFMIALIILAFVMWIIEGFLRSSVKRPDRGRAIRRANARDR